jgi:hypothetical protein
VTLYTPRSPASVLTSNPNSRHAARTGMKLDDAEQLIAGFIARTPSILVKPAMN